MPPLPDRCVCGYIWLDAGDAGYVCEGGNHSINKEGEDGDQECDRINHEVRSRQRHARSNNEKRRIAREGIEEWTRLRTLRLRAAERHQPRGFQQFRIHLGMEPFLDARLVIEELVRREGHDVGEDSDSDEDLARKHQSTSRRSTRHSNRRTYQDERDVQRTEQRERRDRRDRERREQEEAAAEREARDKRAREKAAYEKEAKEKFRRAEKKREQEAAAAEKEARDRRKKEEKKREHDTAVAEKEARERRKREEKKRERAEAEAEQEARERRKRHERQREREEAAAEESLRNQRQREEMQQREFNRRFEMEQREWDRQFEAKRQATMAPPSLAPSRSNTTRYPAPSLGSIPSRSISTGSRLAAPKFGQAKFDKERDATMERINAVHISTPSRPATTHNATPTQNPHQSQERCKAQKEAINRVRAFYDDANSSSLVRTRARPKSPTGQSMQDDFDLQRMEALRRVRETHNAPSTSSKSASSNRLSRKVPAIAPEAHDFETERSAAMERIAAVHNAPRINALPAPPSADGMPWANQQRSRNSEREREPVLASTQKRPHQRENMPWER